MHVGRVAQVGADAMRAALLVVLSPVYYLSLISNNAFILRGHSHVESSAQAVCNPRIFLFGRFLFLPQILRIEGPRQFRMFAGGGSKGAYTCPSIFYPNILEPRPHDHHLELLLHHEVALLDEILLASDVSIAAIVLPHSLFEFLHFAYFLLYCLCPLEIFEIPDGAVEILFLLKILSYFSQIVGPLLLVFLLPGGLLHLHPRDQISFFSNHGALVSEVAACFVSLFAISIVQEIRSLGAAVIEE